MLSTTEALKNSFTWRPDVGCWSYKFGENQEYELTFEPLLFNGQMYVALYHKYELLAEKVVVKPGL